MKRVAFANIVDVKNLGDMHCNPGRIAVVREELAKVGWEAIPCDFRAVPTSCHAIVFGGGGMLHPGVDVHMAEMAKRFPCATWGIGINYHNEHGPERRKWKETLDAMSGPATIRDPGYGRETTPCPSCLDPRIEVALQQSMQTPPGWKARPLVIYHKEHPINVPVTAPPPRMATNDCSTSFEEMLKLIGNSRAVYTNTFHGAYWALLLGVPAYIPADHMFSSRHYTALQYGAKQVGSISEVVETAKNPALQAHQKEAFAQLFRIRAWLTRL